MKTRVIFLTLLCVLAWTADGHAQKLESADLAAMTRAEGDSLMRSYNYAEALRVLRLAHACDSASPASSRSLAECCYRMGRYAECAFVLGGIKVFNPDSMTYDDNRRLFYAYRNLDDPAFETTGYKLLSLRPYDSEVLASMATYLNENNRPETARELCRGYIKADTSCLAVNRQYAYASYLTGDYKEALDAYSRLERDGFQNYESALIMGIALEELRRPEEAYECLKRAAQYKKWTDRPSLHRLGKVCNEIGRPQEAADYIGKAIAATMPDSTVMTEMYKDRAEAFFGMQSYGRAAECFERSVDYEPGNAINYYNTAQAYIGLKDSQKTLLWLRRFLEKSSSLADTEANRRLIEEVRGIVKGK